MGYSIAMSSNDSGDFHIIAVGGNAVSNAATNSNDPTQGGVFQSTNSGSTWTPVRYKTFADLNSPAELTFDGVAMSSDGKIRVISPREKYFYRSADFGATWTVQDVNSDYKDRQFYSTLHRMVLYNAHIKLSFVV